MTACAFSSQDALQREICGEDIRGGTAQIAPGVEPSFAFKKKIKKIYTI
jgi:hypothetical protein